MRAPPFRGIVQDDQEKPLKKGQKGFTLIELLVALGVVGLLMLLAVPEISLSIRKSRVQECAKRLASDITVARANAQSGGQRAVVVVSKGNMYDFNGNGTLKHFFVFLDANRNDAFNGGETVVAQDACSVNVQMEPSGSPLPDCTKFANAQCVKFSTLGTLLSSATDTIVQMTYNDGSTNQYRARVTVVSMTGLTTTQVSEDGGNTWKDF